MPWPRRLTKDRRGRRKGREVKVEVGGSTHTHVRTLTLMTLSS